MLDTRLIHREVDDFRLMAFQPAASQSRQEWNPAAAPGNLSGAQLFKKAMPGRILQSRTSQGVPTVQRTFTYALLLASTLALAACEDSPESKMESAKESLSDAAESMSEAAEQKADEVMGTEPTTGEKIEEAADDAAEAMKDAGEAAKDAVDGQ
jgi:hypothetical protein